MIPIEQKAPPGDRTAAEWNDVANAGCCFADAYNKKIYFYYRHNYNNR